MTTKISWCDETWNWLVGCSRVPGSPGCKKCYAAEAASSARLQQFQQYQKVEKWNGTIEFVESQLLKPLSWRSPKKIFTCSMSDVFHENVPDLWRDRAFAVMALCPQHTFQVLTKRPEIMLKYISELTILRLKRSLPDHIEYSRLDSVKLPLQNVWLGVSVENQETAYSRIPILLESPAAIRFLSCEPLLEEIDLSEWISEYIGKGICDVCDKRGVLYALNGSPLAGGAICTNCASRISWVIIGGESGGKARECNINWIRSLINQCQKSKVSIFVKQLGSNPINEAGERIKLKSQKGGNIDEFPNNLKIRQFPM